MTTGPQPLTYREIDLRATEMLLKDQGVLTVDLGRYHAWLFSSALNYMSVREERRAPKRAGLPGWLDAAYGFVVFDVLLALSHRLSYLSAIYANHCRTFERQPLANGGSRFILA